MVTSNQNHWIMPIKTSSKYYFYHKFFFSYKNNIECKIWLTSVRSDEYFLQTDSQSNYIIGVKYLSALFGY